MSIIQGDSLMRKLGQKGFTLVESLLAVIALSLVIGVGYYVMNANKDEKPAAVTSQKSDTKATETTQAAGKEYLNITELGIKIPIGDSLKAAKYEINPAQDNYAGVATQGFIDAVTACKAPDTASASFPAIGVIAKYDGTYDANAKPHDVYAEFVKQLPGFYLEYGHADGGLCNGSDTAKNTAAQALFDKLSPDLKTAVQQAEVL